MSVSLENLITEQNAYFRAEGSAGEARAESRLFDAAIAAGMSYDHDDLHGWVAERVTAWLVSGPMGDCPQCGEPDCCASDERICAQCAFDNDAEDFDRCEGIYAW